MSFLPMDEQIIKLRAKIQCALCHSNVNVYTIEKQIKEGLVWHILTSAGSAVCGYCFEEIEKWKEKKV